MQFSEQDAISSGHMISNLASAERKRGAGTSLLSLVHRVWSLSAHTLVVGVGWVVSMVHRVRWGGEQVISGECPAIFGDQMIRRKIVETPLACIYLHRILRSDSSSDAHDHPWDYISLILRGGYFERLPNAGGGTSHWRGPGSVLIRRANTPHHISLEQPALTLVLVGPRRRVWGFHTQEGWIDGRKYPYRSEADCAHQASHTPS